MKSVNTLILSFTLQWERLGCLRENFSWPALSVVHGTKAIRWEGISSSHLRQQQEHKLFHVYQNYNYYYDHRLCYYNEGVWISQPVY